MSNAAVLDITRLYSRRTLHHDTGIDRVERGVFEVMCKNEENRYLLRNGKTYFLFNARGAKKLFSKARKGKLTSQLQLRHRSIRRGKANIRLDDFAQFYHLGHIRHSDEFWQNLKNAGIKTHIMIHDVIPLDFPETTRTDQLLVFKNNFSQWVRYGDRIITPSHYSEHRILAHSRPKKEIIVSPLYVQQYASQAQRQKENRFVIIGTIEPRKNHITILRAWQELQHRMGANCPKLDIIGARGWKNQDTFDFLDHSPMMNKLIFEHGPLKDDAMQEYFSKAQAILFPSIAEGFGLPFYEAILAGQNILASDIPAFREAVSKPSTKCLLPAQNVRLWADAVADFQPQKFKLQTRLPENWNDFLNAIS